MERSVEYGDDLSATPEEYAKDFGTIDQSPVIELYNAQNPDTSDAMPSVLIACIFLFMLNVVIDKRKMTVG